MTKSKAPRAASKTAAVLTEEEKELFDSVKPHFGSRLKLPREVQDCHEKDISKKANRKNRFLFAFPGLFGFRSNGKIGTLENIDTPNPIIYIEFPEVCPIRVEAVSHSNL